MDFSQVLVLFAAPFWMLLVGHAVMDYSWQTDWIGKGKNRHLNVWDPKIQNYTSGVPWYYIMAAHCLMHGGMVTVFTGSVYLGVAEFGIHYIIDVAKCEKKINVHEDQLAHVICKALWAGLLVAAKIGV